jgi:hypothetical protein
LSDAIVNRFAEALRGEGLELDLGAMRVRIAMGTTRRRPPVASSTANCDSTLGARPGGPGIR